MKTIALILFIFLVGEISAQEYYYYKGQKINLTKKENHFIVKLKAGQDSNLFINQNIQKKDYQKLLLGEDIYSVFNPNVLNNERILSEIEYENPVYTSNEGASCSPTNRIVIKLKKISYQPNNPVFENLTFEKVYEFDSKVLFYNIIDNKKSNAFKICQDLINNESIEYVEPDFICFIQPASNPYYSNQWGLKNTGQTLNYGTGHVYYPTSGIDIDVENAWLYTKGCSNIKIAVIDEGVDLSHPDLSANLITGYDPTGNGSNGGPLDDDYHGTNVAGIIGAVDNNIGVVGIANGCKIAPIRGYYTNYRGNSTYTIFAPSVAFSTNLASSFNWARITGNVDVINCSWVGVMPTFLLSSAIDNAATLGRGGLGIIIVFAIGNADYDFTSYPAAGNTKLIKVGAINITGNRWGNGGTFGSNYGDDLDFMAPGDLVPTTDISSSNYGWDYLNTSSLDAWKTLNGDYNLFSATSCATPHVAGICGLVLSVNPNLNRDEVIEVLSSSSKKISNYNYDFVANRNYGRWNYQMGYGLVNAYTAVEFAYDTYYYQNQTLNNLTENHIRIFAGRNVKPTQTQGNVIVPYTSTSTLTAKRIIHLKEGFKAIAGIGTKFLAKIDNTILPATSITCPSLVSEVIVPQDNGNTNSTNNERTNQKLYFKINLYPSPAINELNISTSFKSNLPSMIIITDLVGRKVFEKQYNDSNIKDLLDISNFKDGTYFLTLSNNTLSKTVKFVVAK